jgi:EAL domain-containing protein (putative c-di-GMP-specific phosphodiesterase class I)
MVDHHELFVTASIGFSLNVDGMGPADLLRDADAAMYRAKDRGRDRVEAFQAGGHVDSALALRTAGELRKGIERDEIVPYFQPIVDLETGRFVGFEALARWLHPDRGLLPPSDFLPLAEETGLLVELGTAMLRNSLAQLARWRAVGMPAANGFISVNVGTRQLIDPAFHSLVAGLLAETGIDADSVWLEITETALLADVKAVTVSLRELRNLGLHLSVDDFGTGYSSLTYLKRFPVEAIKIDRAFVNGLGIEADDTTIVDAVIKLGQALGLAVVAEGIETPLQLARLRELGCNRGQGYLFGRPRPAALIEADQLHV